MNGYIFDESGAQRVVRATQTVEHQYKMTPPPPSSHPREVRAEWFGELKEELEKDSSAIAYVVVKNANDEWETTGDEQEVFAPPLMADDETIEAGKKVYVRSIFGRPTVLIVEC